MAGVIIWICCALLIGIVIIHSIQDFRLFKRKGQQIYAFKSTNGERYITLVIQGVWLVIMILNDTKDKMNIGIGVILCMVLSCIVIIINCLKKSGFYEQIVSINGNYYAKERIKSYYWTNYVMQSENSGLILEITNLLNKKKTTKVEITIPKADREKIEMILAGYGIKE